jgi:hypothetical protein
VLDHAFAVRPGSPNLTPQQWRAVNTELRDWFPDCRLETDISTEMGPFGVRVARRITLTLADGPESPAAARQLLRRALERAGRGDLVDLEPR